MLEGVSSNGHFPGSALEASLRGLLVLLMGRERAGWGDLGADEDGEEEVEDEDAITVGYWRVRQSAEEVGGWSIGCENAVTQSLSAQD